VHGAFVKLVSSYRDEVFHIAFSHFSFFFWGGGGKKFFLSGFPFRIFLLQKEAKTNCCPHARRSTKVGFIAEGATLPLESSIEVGRVNE